MTLCKFLTSISCICSKYKFPCETKVLFCLQQKHNLFLSKLYLPKTRDCIFPDKSEDPPPKVLSQFPRVRVRGQEKSTLVLGFWSEGARVEISPDPTNARSLDLKLQRQSLLLAAYLRLKMVEAKYFAPFLLMQFSCLLPQLVVATPIVLGALEL